MTIMEDKLHLEQTAYFIDQNPKTVRCYRQPVSSTGTGGFVRGDWGDQGPRRVRVVGQSVPTTRVTADGRTVQPIAAAIAMPEDDWQVADRFIADGIKYEIVFIQMLPPWRKRMEVIQYA